MKLGERAKLEERVGSKIKPEEIEKAKKILGEEWPKLYSSMAVLPAVAEVYAEYAPYMVNLLLNAPFMERTKEDSRALDPKTRELVLVSICAAMRGTQGMIVHIEGALKEGATKEEIAECVFWAAYCAAKGTAVALAQGLKTAFHKYGTTAQAKR